MTDEQEQPEPQRPLLRVITPGASDEEVAALVAVVSAMAAASDDEAPAPRSTWSSPARLHRTTYAAGRGGWRASALPR